MSDAWGYIKSHPWIIAIAVFVLGAFWIMSRSVGSGATDAGLAAAYYGAVSADRQSVTQQIITQTQANAAVALAGIQADAYTGVQTKWADTQLAIRQSDNAAATAGLPYQLASQYIGTLGELASTPPTVTTQKSSGFFGIGGSSKQIVTPNPTAVAANQALLGFDFDFMQGFLPGH